MWQFVGQQFCGTNWSSGADIIFQMKLNTDRLQPFIFSFTHFHSPRHHKHCAGVSSCSFFSIQKLLGAKVNNLAVNEHYQIMLGH